MTYVIHFQGAALRTPQGKPFAVPTENLKNSIESEIQDLKSWPAKVNTKTMTALALAACDRMAAAREQVIQGLLKDLETDLLLLWVESPEKLVQLQNEMWLPLIQKFNEIMGMNLQPVMTLSVPELTEDGTRFVRNYLEALNDFQLTGLSHLAQLTHSPILAILGLQGHVGDVFQASELPESFQRSQWGEEPMALERSAHIEHEINETLAFLRALE